MNRLMTPQELVKLLSTQQGKEKMFDMLVEAVKSWEANEQKVQVILEAMAKELKDSRPDLSFDLILQTINRMLEPSVKEGKLMLRLVDLERAKKIVTAWKELTQGD